MFAYPLTGLATVFISLIYLWTTLRTGKAREKYSIAAPATTGNLDFERVFRVQQNTLEMIVLFLPAYWLFAVTYIDSYVAILGVVFGIGRIIYARGYYAESQKRGLGFMISFFATLIAIIGAIYGMVISVNMVM